MLNYIVAKEIIYDKRIAERQKLNTLNHCPIKNISNIALASSQKFYGEIFKRRKFFFR